MATLDSYALHPDGKRVGMMVQEQGTGVLNNKVVFFFNFSDYLRSLTK
jgi:hypothetical protein